VKVQWAEGIEILNCCVPCDEHADSIRADEFFTILVPDIYSVKVQYYEVMPERTRRAQFSSTSQRKPEISQQQSSLRVICNVVFPRIRTK